VSEPTFTLAALAELTGARCIGDPRTLISGLGSLANAAPGQISHLSASGYRGLLDASNASAVILRAADAHRWKGNALVVDEPYLAFARISQLFARVPDLSEGVDPSARVAASAQIHPTAAVGPGTCIGERVDIAAHVRVYANCVIGDDCVVHAGTLLMPSVVLYSNVELGERCVVHSGAVIGADGFGFTPDDSGHLQPIAQLGGVRIGADVSVGAASTIDRGAIDDTVVEDGVKIDNQVQVGHNCHIGAHTVICGCVGIAGSVSIGKHCIIAGACGIGGAGPIEIADRVVLTAATNVLTSISEPGTYSGGTVHSETRSWKRNALRFTRLDQLGKRVSALERNWGKATKGGERSVDDA
jgi:UDP-3-O-[3-hydroxymyristoyl] glucosamine N-acyltransferase